MLSTTAEYALRALISLAQEPDKATLGRDLAASSGVPANYLSKSLLELKKSDLDEVLERFPQVREALEKAYRERLAALRGQAEPGAAGQE